MSRFTLLQPIVFFFLMLNLCHAQNIVPNPSFENYSSTYCGIMVSTDFNQTMVDWVNPTLGSPQVFFTNISNTCYNYQPYSQYSGPIGLKGNQSPRTGNVMTGIWLYTIPNFDQRQYIQTELISPMIAGNTYIVEFYVSLADSMEVAIDKIGAYLSVNQPSSNNDGPLSYTPQVLSKGFIDDITNWVLISDTIVAQDAYTYITIGNFYLDQSTNTTANPANSGSPGTYGAFYFVDDVRVEMITSVGIKDIQDDELLIYPTIIANTMLLEVPFDSEVKIFDSSGQLIFSQKVKKGLEEINTSGFSEGIYIVSIQNREKTLTRRIVK